MDYILFELQWMLYNVFLALLPVIFIYLAVKSKSIFFRTIWFLLWLFFLPNTLYLLTDITHFSESIEKTPAPFAPLTVILFILLMLVGVVTFLLALSTLEKFLQKKKINNIFLLLIIINLLVGFGIILGRVERANSWDILLHPLILLWNAYTILLYPKLLTAAFIWGIISNIFYFSLRNSLKKVKQK